MKVVCASCEREGKPSYLGEREPYDNPSTTHGICSRHKEQALEATSREVSALFQPRGRARSRRGAGTLPRAESRIRDPHRVAPDSIVPG